MSNKLVLIILSVLPVILIAKYINNKDEDKEPRNLLIKLFMGGLTSVYVAIFLTIVLGSIFPVLGFTSDELTGLDLILNIFIGVALVEEFSKWIIVYNVAYNNISFDELYDAIVYCVFVALGFACYENILYVLGNGVTTAIIRGLLAVPGHACDGVFMGYYLGLAKISNNNRYRKKYLKLSIIIPTITHGIYDYLLSLNNNIFIIIFFIFIICIYINAYKKIKNISFFNEKIKD